MGNLFFSKLSLQDSKQKLARTLSAALLAESVGWLGIFFTLNIRGMYLQNERIYLRALEPEDLGLLYKWENDPELWCVGSATEPYSRYILKEYIAYGDKSIYEKKQLRLMVCCASTKNTIGIIDLFDFDAFHLRAGVGILIDKGYQGKGYASEALSLLIDYSFQFLNINQLYAHVPSNNGVSRGLFVKNDFQYAGCLKNWLRSGDSFIDVEVYQLISKA